MSFQKQRRGIERLETRRRTKFPETRFFRLTVGAAGLMCMALFISPWSSSTQPSGFSLALDLDDAAGDQAVSSLDVSPEQVFPIQIFAMDIQNATGISMRFGYDGTQAADLRGIRSRRGPAERPCHRTAGFHFHRHRRFVVERIGNGEHRPCRHGASSHQRRLFGHGGVAGARRACPGRRDRGNIARPRCRAAGGRAPFARLRRQWAGGVLGLRGLCRRLRGAPWRREIRGGVRSEQRRRYRLRRLCNLRLEFRRSCQPGARVRRLASGDALSWKRIPRRAGPSAIPSSPRMPMATPSRMACAGCTRTAFPLARAQGSC